MRLTGKDVKRDRESGRAYSPRIRDRRYFRKRLYTHGPRQSTIHAAAAAIQAAESQCAEDGAVAIEIATIKNEGDNP